MLIKDNLIIKMARECHEKYIDRVKDKIRRESLRLTEVTLTKEDIDIINLRIVALKEIQKSICDITRFINLDEDILSEFFTKFAVHPNSYCYVKINDIYPFDLYYEISDQEKKTLSVRGSIKLEIDNLEKCFFKASTSGAKYIGVKIKMLQFEDPQVIIDTNENFDKRFSYYKEVFGENLESDKGNKIIGFTYGDSFSEIESDLIKE